MKRSAVLGTEIDRISLTGAAERALALMAQRRGAYVVTPNTEIVLSARRDPELRAALGAAALSLCDGVGVLIASRILGDPIGERITGIDFASALLSRMAGSAKSVFLLGAREGVAARAAEALQRAYPGLVIAGTENGYFDAKDEDELLGRINALSPDLLLVCLGSPKQEKWMHRCAPRLKVGLMAGLGGALDVFSGDVKRAPPLWRRYGLEWLYRLLRQPERLKRDLALPRIVFLALRDRIGGKKEKWQTGN